MTMEFKLPELGESVSEGTVAKILVAVGDTIAANQSVFELETDKAVAEIPCSIAGAITEIRVAEGDKVKAGQVMLVLDAASAGAATPTPTKEAAKKQAAVPAAASQAAPAVAKTTGKVLASPTVRRLARELGVDLKSVPTSDPQGRVTADDVRRFAEGGASPAASAPAVSAPATPSASLADFEQGTDSHGPVAFEPMNAIRRKTAEHMTRCWTTIPHVTQFDKADITDVEILRKKHADKVSAQGGRLTAIAFVLKALSEALKRFPKFNASLDLESERIIFKQYQHIGVAVETPLGLLVPVLRDVDRKSVAEIAVELPAIAAKARDRKISLEELQGGTFTVTNLGGLGGTAFTPIINAPQVAILGMSRSAVEPVWQKDAFVPRTMLPLSLSYDHRIIDGADAARFLRWLAQALEQPWTMFLGV
jgi:pyruvate dehydrogenase E2 component (dihydrolipoamide acetyltransferase)